MLLLVHPNSELPDACMKETEYLPLSQDDHKAQPVAPNTEARAQLSELARLNSSRAMKGSVSASSGGVKKNPRRGRSGSVVKMMSEHTTAGER